MEITESSDTDSLFAATPVLPGQLLRLQSTTGCGPAYPPRAENIRQSDPTSSSQATAGQPCSQPVQKSIHFSLTATNTGAHLQQPNSEANEADYRCFQVSFARRLMLLTRPQASQPTSHPPVQTSALPNEQWLAPTALQKLQKRPLTRRLSHRSLSMLGSYPLPAVVSRLRFLKREEKKKFDRYPPTHESLRPCDDLVAAPQKFIEALYSDTDHPTTATRDAWTAIQTTTQQHEPSPCDPASGPDATCFTTVPTLAASSCWRQCLLSVFILTPGACLLVLTVSPHVLIVCSSGLSGPRCFPLQLSGSLPRPTSGRNVTSGRRPTLLAARLALHTTLVKQPLASPSWSIVPVARACAHQDSCT